MGLQIFFWFDFFLGPTYRMDMLSHLRGPNLDMSLQDCVVMGILNVTPDSFSDGNDFMSLDRALRRAWQMVEEGAKILDVGAESTRPYAQPVDEQEEQRRLWPLLEALRESHYPLPISLDTGKPNIAQAALAEGLVHIINDVGGLRQDQMLSVVKTHQAPVVVMHMHGEPRTMQDSYHYHDVIGELVCFFQNRLRQLDNRAPMIIDPGLGFGKGVDHNLMLLNGLNHFQALGCPVMVGASRKSFIGKILDSSVDDRLEGSLASVAIAVYKGCQIVRVHDVKPTVRVVRMVEAIMRGK